MASSNAKKKTSSRSAPKRSASGSARTKPAERSSLPTFVLISVLCIVLALLTMIGFFTSEGFVVIYFCAFIKGIMGYGFWLFPFALIWAAVLLLGKHRARAIPVALLPILFGALLHLILADANLTSGGFVKAVSELYGSGKLLQSGGVIGGGFGSLLRAAISVYGAVAVLIAGIIVCLLVALHITPAMLREWFGSRADAYADRREERAAARELAAAERAKAQEADPWDDLLEPEPPRRKRRGAEVQVAQKKLVDIPFSSSNPNLQPEIEDKPERSRGRKKPAAPREVQPLSVEEAADLAGVDISSDANERVSSAKSAKKLSASEVESETAAIAAAIEQGSAEHPEYKLPPMDLLRASKQVQSDASEELRFNRDRLETALRSFGVNASIRDFTRGPTVTRYDLELEAGVKLNKITNLSGDLALALGVENVRIAPVPEKISTVGIEVPNKVVSMVCLRDILDSNAFRSAKSKVSFAVGKDIAGNCIIGNISKLPHMLIAGTTGSGKSVFMNSLILSILYKATPEEVRLIMIDPKMVEFGVYNGIPHLYIPVVTDPKKAAGALQWAVVEMLKRYRLFSEAQVRDLESYNAIQRTDPDGEILPTVVIVIDELADLMLCAAKEVEESICRVAQMGRAAGMHLVIATQRPSSDVITGLMKANIPSRVALSVSSGLDSRIILDMQGAEKLIGNGDMLYAPITLNKPLRVQGSFVSDAEREQVVAFIKQNSEADYSDDIMAQIEKAAVKEDAKSAKEESSGGKSDDYDELLPQAVDVILETNQASVSLLQRRLKLGYSRAARLVDQMEEIGVVGPFQGSKPRDILITKQQWQEMQLVQGTAPGEVLQAQLDFDASEEVDDDVF